MTNDQHSPTPTPPSSALASTRASESSATSRGRSSIPLPDPLTDTSRFTISLEARRPFGPSTPRLPDDTLDLKRLTLGWLAWRRLATNGADMPAHELAPRGPNQTFTVAQLVAYRQWFGFIPRPYEAAFKLGFDKPGRHAHPLERVGYTTNLAWRTLTDCGLFG